MLAACPPSCPPRTWLGGAGLADDHVDRQGLRRPTIDHGGGDGKTARHRRDLAVHWRRRLLLSHNSAPVEIAGQTGGQSWFEILAHGIGIYFIGKGLYVARSTHLDSEAVDSLRKLVNAAAFRHSDRTEQQRGATSSSETAM